MNLKDLATERRNPASMHIDTVSTEQMLSIINAEDQKVALAVEQEIPNIARAVDAIAVAIRRGGRLVYLGAGTSGRLGVLDASECPPTFGVPEGVVVALMAGGQGAMFRASEGAEDDAARGESDLRAIAFSEKDVLVGIAASGRTPYVLGGMRYAEGLGAVTVSLACTPDPAIAAHASISITPVTGPEAVTGSTRMKAGTAQKLVLNMLSTGAMVKLGRVYGNLMVDVKATNGKLRDRAERIVAEAAGVGGEAAAEALALAGGHAKTAICMLLTGLNAADAQALLGRHGGVLSASLAEYRGVKGGTP